MNKELKDKIYEIPPLILSGIRNSLKKYPSDKDGVKRAKTLLSGKVTYGQLKRILHDMKRFQKNGSQDINEIGKFELAGGKPFESWGWATLNGDRDVIEFNKKMRKNADSMGGIEGRRNAYNKKHKKNPNFNTPTTFLKSNSEKGFVTSLKTGKLFEEVERIKELMI